MCKYYFKALYSIVVESRVSLIVAGQLSVLFKFIIYLNYYFLNFI